MEKIESIEETIFELKQGTIITLNGNDSFYLRNNMITHRFKGNSYRIDIDTFKELYKDKCFYYKEDNSIFIDDEKDRDYYQYYKK